MAEYNSDEERFAAVINFFKDYKTIILSSLAIIFISLISIISLTNKPSESVALKNGMKIEKVTEYNKNKVNVFRIYKSEWNKIKPVYNNV